MRARGRACVRAYVFVIQISVGASRQPLNIVFCLSLVDEKLCLCFLAL